MDKEGGGVKRDILSHPNFERCIREEARAGVGEVGARNRLRRSWPMK